MAPTSRFAGRCGASDRSDVPHANRTGVRAASMTVERPHDKPSDEPSRKRTIHAARRITATLQSTRPIASGHTVWHRRRSSLQ